MPAPEQLNMAEAREMPSQNADQDEIRQLLARARTIAVVGLSNDPSRASFRVASYLQRQGYNVIAVNPTLEEVLGEKAYPSLRDVSGQVDIVDIFRRPDAIPGIVDDAIAIGAGAIWMQLGLAHNAAADKARAAGLTVVMDKCLMLEHNTLIGGR